MEWDRTLTDVLYGGDQHYRLCQEVILGIGGVRMLRALGHDRLTRFHMNEGHASLLTVELIDEEVTRAGRSTVTHEDIEAVREQCIFTTHTKDGRDGGDGPRVVSSLYDKLEQTVIPLFYQDRPRFLQVMAHAIALNGSFFNTHRMVQQYVLKAYF